MATLAQRMNQLERDVARSQVGAAAQPSRSRGTSSARRPNSLPASRQAWEAVQDGTASLAQYRLVLVARVEDYRRSCLAWVPLFLAGLTHGYPVCDDRVAVAYPPGVAVPEEVGDLHAFTVWLATATRQERDAYALEHPGRAAHVSPASRADAAVVMLVFGDAAATRLREQAWAQEEDGGWMLTRATWAPSETTELPTDAFEAVLGLDGQLHGAVAQGRIRENNFRLDPYRVALLITEEEWEGPNPPAPLSKNVKFAQLPERVGYRDYPSYIAYSY